MQVLKEKPLYFQSSSGEWYTSPFFMPSCVERPLEKKAYGKFSAHALLEHEFDEGIGLQYHGARYYDPEIGMYIGPDPMRQFHDLYSYTGGNPVNLIDPLGLATYKIIRGEDPDGMDMANATDAAWSYFENLDSFDPDNDQIIIMDAKSNTEIIDYIENHNVAGPTAGVLYLGHSGYLDNVPILAPNMTTPGGNFTLMDAMEMRPTFTPNAFVRLCSCTSSEIAQGLSYYWGVPTIGNISKTIGIDHVNRLPVSTQVLLFNNGNLVGTQNYNASNTSTRY